MTLRARFALSLLTIAVALLVPLALAVRSVQHVERELRGLRSSEFRASLALGQLREQLNELRTTDTRMFALRDEQSLTAMQRSTAAVQTLVTSLAGLQLRDEALALRRALNEITPNLREEYELARSGQWDAADSISENVVGPAINRALADVKDAELEISRSTAERVQQAEQSIDAAQLVSIVALVVALLFVIVVAVRLTQAVQQPVTELERGMAAVADGDFTQQLHLAATRPDEFGRLAASFESMARQLAELDKLKAEFVSIASHELKTPLNVIMGYLELLSEGIYGSVTEKQKEIIGLVQAQAHTVTRLAKQLLDVSRFEAGGGKLEPRPISLHKLLDDLEKAFHVLAVQRSVRFRVVRGDALPDDVVWDPDRVNEVLGNLLSNAFKFTERGGEVELTAESAHGSIHFEVRDTGAGIPAEQVPRVFDKFYQADNQRHSSRGGTGLGLAIAKGIVDAHGGTITVESTRGVGTTFNITMPIAVTSGRRTPLRETIAVAEAGV
jgi:signal transduction histidine kinase